MDGLAESFNAEFQRVYGRRNARVQVEALSWQIQASSPRPDLRIDESGAFRRADPVPTMRRASFEESGRYNDCPAYARSVLAPRARSEARSVGKESVSTCRYRWSRDH